LPTERCQFGCDALVLSGPDALGWMKEKPDIREIGLPDERTHRNFLKKKKGRTSLVVQGLKLWATPARGPGLIPY